MQANFFSRQQVLVFFMILLSASTPSQACEDIKFPTFKLPGSSFQGIKLNMVKGQKAPELVIGENSLYFDRDLRKWCYRDKKRTDCESLRSVDEPGALSIPVLDQSKNIVGVLEQKASMIAFYSVNEDKTTSYEKPHLQISTESSLFPKSLITASETIDVIAMSNFVAVGNARLRVKLKNAPPDGGKTLLKENYFIKNRVKDFVDLHGSAVAGLQFGCKTSGIIMNFQELKKWNSENSAESDM